MEKTERGRFLEAQVKHEDPVMAFLVDIPLCTTTALPDFNRGYVEEATFFQLPETVHDLIPAGLIPERKCGPSDQLVQLRRSDLDENARLKRDECDSCRHDSRCEGVWGNYVRRYGWDEFVPVD
jgi:cyclic pyranopterin phosphate synthase